MSDELEDLLREQSNTVTIGFATKTPGSGVYAEQSSHQRADGNASNMDLIRMISKLVAITLKDLNVEFIPDDGRRLKIELDNKIEHPFITYKTVSRTTEKELKPRQREEIKEKNVENGTERYGEVYAQKFKSVLQFNVFASVYDVADKVMERFEELMLLYTGYFKKNGVSELLFEKQITDSSYDIFREIASVRSLQYSVETEKITVQFKEDIKAIEYLLNN
jgi:hypothetical protein